MLACALQIARYILGHPSLLITIHNYGLLDVGAPYINSEQGKRSFSIHQLIFLVALYLGSY